MVFSLDFLADAAEIAVRWLQSLKSERRMAAKTLEAYARDVSQFGQFLKDHLGNPPGVSDLASLTVFGFSQFHGAAAERSGWKAGPLPGSFQPSAHSSVLPKGTTISAMRLFRRCARQSWRIPFQSR